MDSNSISVSGQAVLLIAYIAAVLVVTRYFLWVLQAGSYRSRHYFRVLMQEPMRWLPLIGSFIPGAMVILRYVMPGVITTLVYVLVIFFFYRKLVYRLHMVPRQKFVVTHRIVRLLGTYGILWLALPILVLILRQRAIPAHIHIIFFVLWFTVQPLLVALALAINIPIENRVRRYYSSLAARRIAARSDLLTIGITGSYGKTTVKDALSGILQTQYCVLKTEGSINTRMGIARTINERLRPEHQVFVCEMGARVPGDIEALCRMVQPSAGVITSVGSRNMETFHSLRNILKTRYELLDDVDQRGGQMFVNGDNRLLREHMKYPDAITYGFSADCDYHGVLLDMDSGGSTFSVTGPEGQYGEYHTKLVGRYNLVDLMGAIAVANRQGIPMERMVDAVEQIAPAPHHLRMKMYGRTCVIDDTANTSLGAAAVALETLSMFDSIRILITPGVCQGSATDTMEDILSLAARAAVSADYIILVGHDQTREIYQNIIEDGFHPDHIFLVDTMSDARLLASQISPDQERVILLENSLPGK